MVHSDDKGLVAPPRLAPVQVVIVPIGKAEVLEQVTAAADQLAGEIKQAGWDGEKVRVHVDKREKLSPGYKFNDWELKGACLRIELGPRDLEAGVCVMARRDGGEKQTLHLSEAPAAIQLALTEFGECLYNRALEFLKASTHRVDNWEEFMQAFSGEGGAGFVLAHWDGTTETEEKIAELTKATIRCIPLEPLAPEDDQPGVCVLTGRPSQRRVAFARAY
jgi:prolyl-tRNA synthetase